MKQLQRSSFLNKSVSKVYFKCNVSSFVQIYSLAVRTSVAVNFANLPLKECEFALKQKTPVGWWCSQRMTRAVLPMLQQEKIQIKGA